MTSKTQTSGTSSRGKRLLRIPLYIVAGLVALILLALAVTQTGWFKNQVRSRLEQAANEALRARVSIGEIGGSLLFSLQVSDIALMLEGDSVLAVSEIRAEYSPWSLLGGSLQIESLVIDDPRIWLERNSAGVWNVANLTKPDTPKEVQQDRAAKDDSGLPIDIFVKRMALNGGLVRTQGTEPPIPSRVSNLDFTASASITDPEQRVSIDSLSFKTQGPEFTLKRLAAVVSVNDTSIALQDLVLLTALNRITGKASYAPDDLSKSELVMSADSLALNEFAFVVPELGLAVEPDISLDVTLRGDTAVAVVSASHSNEKLRVDARLWPFSVVMTDSVTTAMEYTVDVTTEQVNWAAWMESFPISFVTSGTVSAQGSGFNPDSARVSLDADLSSGSIAGRQWDTLSLHVEYDEGSATLDSRLAAPSGELTVQGELDSLLGIPRYDLVADIAEIDLSLLNGDTLLQSDLSGRVEINGTHFNPDSISGKVVMSLTPSHVGGNRLDTLFARVDATLGRFDVDSFFVKSTVAEAAGHGELVMRDRQLSLDARIVPGDLSAIAQMAGLDTLVAGGTVDLEARGNMDSLSASGEFNLAQLHVNDGEADSLWGSFSLPLMNFSPGEISLGLQSHGVRYAGIDLGRVTVDASVSRDTLRVELSQSSGDSISVSVVGDIVTAQRTSVSLEELSFGYFEQNWQLDDAPAILIIDSTQIGVDSLAVSSGSGDRRSLMLIDGNYALQGDHDLHMMLTRLNIGALLDLMPAGPAIEGQLSGGIDWTGPAAEPDLAVDLTATEMTANDVKVDSLVFTARHHVDSIDLDATAYFPGFPPLELNGYLPFSLEGDAKSVVPMDQPMHLELVAEHVPMKALLAAVPRLVDGASGWAACSLTVENTLEQPHIFGNAGIYDAGLKIEQYGVDYQDIQLRLSLDQQRINIDSLSARRGKGSIRASGYFALADEGVTGEVRATSIDLTADRFYVTQHNHYEIQVSGNVGLEADAEEARYSGDITVHRSRLYLPTLTAEGGVQDPSARDLPMLVKAVYDSTREQVSTADSVAKETGPSALQASRLYERMRGTAKVSLPRNTWIRSPDMRIELSGSLDVVKEGEEPELFGTINTVRGHYDLYGRRFSIEEGQLIFQGGTDYNPRLSITAEYVFRGANRVKRTLLLLVSGTAQRPELAFKLDGSDISEGDALAYILFGRSFDQLTRGQQGEVGEQSSGRELAQGVAAGVVADQLAKTLGREFRLDVIDIRAKSDFGGAAFEVGKYLTTDLFVSYQRGFGSAEDNEFAPEIVTLEYELTRNIFLRLVEGNSRQSGFDVIFRLRE